MRYSKKGQFSELWPRITFNAFMVSRYWCTKIQLGRNFPELNLFLSNLTGLYQYFIIIYITVLYTLISLTLWLSLNRRNKKCKHGLPMLIPMYSFKFKFKNCGCLSTRYLYKFKDQQNRRISYMMNRSCRKK